jgi:acetyltransferase
LEPDHRTPGGTGHVPEGYPAHLIRAWTLPTGEKLTMRPLRHDDGAREEEFVRSLSRESGYQRMLSGGIKVTPEWIDYMINIDYRRQMAFAITIGDGSDERFVGVGRYAVEAGRPAAEFALVIGDAWQRKGLGRRLLEALIEHAQAAGLTELTGVAFATNVAMLRLAAALGFSVSAEPGDARLRRLRRAL